MPELVCEVGKEHSIFSELRFRRSQKRMQEMN